MYKIKITITTPYGKTFSSSEYDVKDDDWPKHEKELNKIFETESSNIHLIEDNSKHYFSPSLLKNCVKTVKIKHVK